MNVALEAVQASYGLGHWEGCCMELVNHLLRSHPEGEILWVDLPKHHRWVYHAVLVLDGIVHDAWHPDVMLPPMEYVAQVFGAEATWQIVEEDPRRYSPYRET